MKTANTKLTVKTDGRTDTWHINAELRRIASPLAKSLKLTLKSFLIGVSRDRVKIGGLKLVSSNRVPSGFDVTLPKSQSLQSRVARAADIEEQTIEQFVWGCVVMGIECSEESKIFGAGGEVLGDSRPLHRFRTFQMHDPAMRRDWHPVTPRALTGKSTL